MTEKRLQKARSIFDKLVELPDEQRGPVLVAECAGDTQLRAFVEELLANDDGGMGEFLATPAFQANMDPASTDVDSLPQRIGRYEIIRVIGEGGMGTVYEAKQENPRRLVALKVIRPGMATSNVLRRFKQEADVLGQLQHPGIAQIHEAGMAEVTTEVGSGARHPFFAMELIRGGELHEYVDNARLGIRERLELVARVCDAVQHAHQKGVIHRDLKPGNILIDETGQPKILDFGVARATDAAMQTLTLQTGVGQLIGTLPYMSPEQVAGDSRQLDTRSDVYALGVILFELLSGYLPHEVRNLSIPQAVRKIREDEPQHLGSIDRTLGGEVEIMVARSLEKDKTRRYQSASDLAGDIRRHLRGEAIEARRDSVLYVFRKTVARYRGWVAAGGLLIVLLATFGIISFEQARKNRLLAVREAAARGRADVAAARLAAELIESNIERGRLYTRTGNFLGAENLIWREHLANPRSNHSYWALWELYSRNPSLATFNAHDLELKGTAFSADGRTFISCSLDGTVKIWDAETYQLIVDLKGRGSAMRTVAYSSDSRWIASAGVDGVVMVWDATTYRLEHTLRGHDGPVHVVSFAANGRHLISGSEDTTVSVWDVEEGTCVNVLQEHPAPVCAICFNREAEIMATCSYDGTIKFWKGLAGPSIRTLVDDAGATDAMTFSADGQKLATGDRDRVIKLWNLTDPPSVEILGTPTNGHVRHLAFGPHDETLFSGGWYRMDRWDLISRERQPIIMHGLNGGSICPDGRVVVAGCEGGPIRVYGHCRGHRRDSLGRQVERRCLPRSAPMVASSPAETTRITCSCGKSQPADCSPGFRAPPGDGRRLTFYPSGEMFATCGADGVVQLWDLSKGSPLYSIDGVHVTTGQALSFNPDGGTMAVTRHDQTVSSS